MIVGIVGLRASGKSTIARALVERHGFRVVSPIDPTKRMGVELGFSHHCMFGSSSARDEPHPTLRMPDGSPLTGRIFLDAMGVAIRAVHPDLLLDASMRGDGDLVNESARFHSELEAIRAAGGKLLKRKGGVLVGDAYDLAARELPDSYFDAVIPALEGPDWLDRLHFVVDTLVSGWRSEAEL